MNRFRPVQWLRRHPLAADGILAAMLTVAGLGALWFGSEHVAGSADPNVWSTILILGTTLPLVLRRRNPIPVLCVVSACQFVLEIFNFNSPGWLVVFIALYTVAAHTNGPPRTITARVFAISALVLLIAGVVHADLPIGQFISAIVFLVGAYILGDNLQRRRRQGAEAAERAAIAARERDLLAGQQLQNERARIARELHDVVAHSVSLMIIQAGAARRSIMSSPLQAEAALRDLESTGRQAMDELRRVLGVLRAGDTGDTDLAPQPTLAGIRSLVEDDPTLQIRLTETGTPPDDLPASIGLSLYRVVQEALTNVRKHAGQVKQVSVHVAYEPHQVTVQVTDDGRGASVAVHRGGHGLVGMRERMALCGGVVTAGPRQGGGWQVRASAPLEAPGTAGVAADAPVRPAAVNSGVNSGVDSAGVSP